MQAELADLRSQNDLLKSEQQRLESETKEAQVRNRQQERRIQQLESASNSRSYRPSTPPTQPSSPSSSMRFPYHPSSSKASTSPSTSTSNVASSFAGSGFDRAPRHHGNPPTPPIDHPDGFMYSNPGAPEPGGIVRITLSSFP
jgi:hypothetical protein